MKNIGYLLLPGYYNDVFNIKYLQNLFIRCRISKNYENILKMVQHP